MLDQDCATTQLTEGSPPSCIGTIMFGGYLCTPDVNSYTKGGVSRFAGAWLYRLTCTLPDPKQVREHTAAAVTVPGTLAASKHPKTDRLACW